MKYYADEARKLKSYGELPDSRMLSTGLTCNHRM